MLCERESLGRHFGGRVSGEREKIRCFWNHINDDDTVLDSRSEIVQNALSDYWKVSDPCRELLEERLEPLKSFFARRIFLRGLFAVADDSAAPLEAVAEGVSISVGKADGKLTATLSVTQGEGGICRISFICPTDNPCRLSIGEFCGRYKEIDAMLQKAATPFHDLTAASVFLLSSGRAMVLGPSGGYRVLAAKEKPAEAAYAAVRPGP